MSSLSSLDGSDDGDDEEPLVWDFCSEIVALTVSNEARRSIVPGHGEKINVYIYAYICVLVDRLLVREAALSTCSLGDLLRRAGNIYARDSIEVCNQLELLFVPLLLRGCIVAAAGGGGGGDDD